MSDMFQALLLAAAYARYELELNSHCSLPAVSLDATERQITNGTLSCRQHEASRAAEQKDQAPSLKPPPASESESTYSHPAAIYMSRLQGRVTRTRKDKKKEALTRLNFREDQRIEMLHAEPLIGDVMPNRVWCLECEGWVGLDRRRSYYMGMWKRHKTLYHSPVSS